MASTSLVMQLPGLSKGVADGQVENPKALTLSDLPYDALHHILTFVLSADEVKEPVDEMYHTTETTRPGPKYHFHTAIMRTNKVMRSICKEHFRV